MREALVVRSRFTAPPERIRTDVIALVAQLRARGLLDIGGRVRRWGVVA